MAKNKNDHEKPIRPIGRPTLYNEELADKICMRVATSQLSTRKICQKFDDMPDDTCIYEWRHKYPEFAHKYAQAKMQQAEIMAEEILDISDDDSSDVKYDKDGYETINGEFVARSRLRVDTRKWLASKLAPKIYGDRMQIQTTNNEETEQLKNELKELREKLAQKSQSEY